MLWILSSVTRHYMVLKLHKALWSNCKQMQSSESTFFLCKKYEKNCSFIHFSATRWMSWMTYSSNSNGEYSDSSTRSSPSCFSTSRKPFDAVFTKEMFSGSSSVVVDVDDCWRSLQRSNNERRQCSVVNYTDYMYCSKSDLHLFHNRDANSCPFTEYIITWRARDFLVKVQDHSRGSLQYPFTRKPKKSTYYWRECHMSEVNENWEYNHLSSEYWYEKPSSSYRGDQM